MTILVAGLIAPLAASAQKEKLKECCTFHQDMEWKKGSVYKGTSERKCDNAPTNPCKFKKEETIGNKDKTACPKPSDTGTTVSTVDWNSEQWGMICLVNAVIYVTNWIFYLMIIAVVIVFVIAGAMYMMAGGDSEKTKGAKGLMIYGIVGLVIALIAKLIPSVVRLIVGM